MGKICVQKFLSQTYGEMEVKEMILGQRVRGRMPSHGGCSRLELGGGTGPQDEPSRGEERIGRGAEEGRFVVEGSEIAG